MLGGDRQPVAHRRAVPADAPVLRDIAVAAVTALAPRWYTEAQCQAWIGRLDLQTFARVVADDIVVIADLGGVACGFGSLRLSVPDLDRLFVLPGAGGVGIGSGLVADLVDRAREHRVDRLDVHASRAAVGLFDRLDWRLMAEESVEIDGEQLERFHLRRDLAVPGG